MGIESRFIHELVIERLGPTTSTTPRGHAVRDFVDHHTTRGLIQAKSGTEVLGPDLVGVVVVNGRAYLAAGEDVTPQDRIRRVATGTRFEIVGDVRDPGGVGHHLEADVRSIVPRPLDPAPAP